MITLDSSEKLTIISNQTVTIRRQHNIVGFMNIPYDCVYDFSKIPEKHHALALQIITKI
jgi:hypothetical protein